MKYFLTLSIILFNCMAMAVTASLGESPESENNPPTEGTTETKKSDATISFVEPLENTRLAKSIASGSKEDYKEAFNELVFFKISIEELVEKKTTQGKTIFDLLLEASENKDFFYKESVRLIFSRIIDSDIDKPIEDINDRKVQANIDRQISLLNHLIDKTTKLNNIEAVQLLSDTKQFFENLKVGVEQERSALLNNFTNEKNGINESHSTILASRIKDYRELQAYWKRKHKWRAIRSTVYAGTMAYAGYYLLPYDMSVSDLLNIEFANILALKDVIADTSRYVRDTAGPIMNDRTVLGATSVAVATGLAARAIVNCKRSFNKPKNKTATTQNNKDTESPMWSRGR